MINGVQIVDDDGDTMSYEDLVNQFLLLNPKQFQACGENLANFVEAWIEAGLIREGSQTVH